MAMVLVAMEAMVAGCGGLGPSSTSPPDMTSSSTTSPGSTKATKTIPSPKRARVSVTAKPMSTNAFCQLLLVKAPDG